MKKNEIDFLDVEKIKPIEFKDVDKKIFKWDNIDKFKYNPQFRELHEYKLVYEFRNKKESDVLRVEHKHNMDHFICDFLKYFNPPKHSYKLQQALFSNNGLKIQNFLLLLSNDLIFNYGSQVFLEIKYDKSKYLNDDVSNSLIYFLRLLKNYEINDYKNQINIITKSNYGFQTKGFDVKNTKVDIDINYNDDFKPIYDNIIDNLNNDKNNGLYVFYGVPGTGKTTFIRHLSTILNYKKIIFIPPNMVESIAEPSFIPFLMDNKNSLLIIEDAEPVLQKRGQNNRHNSISNILNVTDGLLGDCLNISIIATFNVSTNQIDDALLRKGRLIQSYEFNKLSTVKSQKLLDELGADVKATEPMTLSDIYYYESNNGFEKNEKKVGFR